MKHLSALTFACLTARVINSDVKFNSEVFVDRIRCYSVTNVTVDTTVSVWDSNRYQ